MRDVILKAGIPDPNSEKDYLKIQTVKFVKDALGLGLKEAKELVDGAPKTVKEGASKEEAEELKAKFAEVGAVVELK